jgi:hypothetical protein
MPMSFHNALIALLLTGLSFEAVSDVAFRDRFEDGSGQMLTVSPAPYERALRNPMKGFTAGPRHEWSSLDHQYFRWNELENDVTDGIDKILQVSDEAFRNGPENNLKFIPRVYLHWSTDEQKHWPADMQTDDYSSEQFRFRVARLIERLGQAWNDDPRVAFIEIGIFGMWGEHHSPSPTEELQALVGLAFERAFPDKQVSVRHVWDEFQGFHFGEYWDSWGHYQQMWGHGSEIAALNTQSQLYLTRYVGGEVAYNWGAWETQPGTTPTDSVSDPQHREFMINSIRWLHGTQLRWISAYDDDDPIAREGAEQIQRVMGYRFLLDEVAFTPNVGEWGLRVEASVTNNGSAPFYYDWPLVAILLDPVTREEIWRGEFSNVDIRDWHPGSEWTSPQWEDIDFWPGKAVVDGWSSEPIRWGQPPQSHRVGTTFFPDVVEGTYILALAVLDPAGAVPSLRFATDNYWHGGYHPVGQVAIGESTGGPLPENFTLDDPANDTQLHYLHD